MAENPSVEVPPRSQTGFKLKESHINRIVNVSFKTVSYILSTAEGLQMAMVTTLMSIRSINLHCRCIFIPFYLPDALIHLTNVSMCWSHLASLKESERDPFTPLQPSPRCLCSSYFSSWRSLPSSNFA